jgi:transposase InsO family protein
VQAELRLGQDIVVSRKRIRRLMRQAGISGLVKVKKGRTTIRVPGVRVADDLVERKFRPDAPNVLWVADIERHEVLCDRVGVRDLRGLPVAAGGRKLGAA